MKKRRKSSLRNQLKEAKASVIDYSKHSDQQSQRIIQLGKEIENERLRRTSAEGHIKKLEQEIHWHKQLIQNLVAPDTIMALRK